MATSRACCRGHWVLLTCFNYAPNLKDGIGGVCAILQTSSQRARSGRWSRYSRRGQCRSCEIGISFHLRAVRSFSSSSAVQLRRSVSRSARNERLIPILAESSASVFLRLARMFLASVPVNRLPRPPHFSQGLLMADLYHGSQLRCKRNYAGQQKTQRVGFSAWTRLLLNVPK